MEHRATVADMVTAHTTKDGGGLTVRLASGHDLQIPAGEPHLPGWIQALSLAETEHFPVYFEIDPANQIVKQLLLCAPRTAESLRPQPSGDVTVLFRRAPSFYTLKRSHPNFENLLALLKRSVEARAALFVAVEPTTLEVLHIQPEPTH